MTDPSSLSQPGPFPRVVRLGYERVLNTFTGSGDVMATGTQGIVTYDIAQQLRSRLVRVPGSPRQDEYRGSLLFRFPVTGDVSANVLEHSSILGGSRGAGIEAIDLHRIMAGPGVRPLSWLRVRGLAGWEWNGQEDKRDAGPVWSGEVDADGMNVEGLAIDGSASWIRTDLGERKPEEGGGRLRLLSTFAGGSGDSLEISYRRQRRELYSGTGTVPIPGGTTVLKREEDVLSMRNALWFATESSLAGVIEGGVRSRGIDRAFRYTGQSAGASYPLPTTIDQLTIDARGRLDWTPREDLRTLVGAGYVSGEETHDVRVPGDVPLLDIDAQRSQARRRSNKHERYYTSMVVESHVLQDMTVRLEGGASILRYDTPDTLNTDDRDEQRLTAGLELAYIFGPGLTVSTRFEGGQSHLVYLSRFQSANNVRIRTLRFAPSVLWQKEGVFSNRLRAEVAASYTVYDYEDRISSVQSFSYRQASWTDSLSVMLSTRMGLEFFGSLRLFERGILRWSDFTERPQRAFLELYLWPRITWELLHDISVGVGFRSFRQERYQYAENVRSYDGAVGSFGPTVSIGAYFRNIGTISMTGWRESQHVNGSLTRTLSNLSLMVETRL